MAGTDNLLLRIDTIVVDGVALNIVAESATLTGVARFTNEVVPSASGDDFNKRRRVPTTLRCQVQFGPQTDVDALAGISGVQITARDSMSGRRALMPNCSFAELGEVGNGAVDVTFNVLSPIQWL